MRKALLIPTALILAFTSCNKQQTKGTVVSTENNEVVGINKVFTMSNKEDSSLLNEEAKYKTYLTLYDATKQYSVHLSISCNNRNVFLKQIENIHNDLKLDVLYKSSAENADNQSELSESSNDRISASNTITYIVISTNLPKDAIGFSLSFKSPKLISSDPEEGPISPGYGYNRGVYFLTLANNLKTFNHGPGNLYLIREYKTHWYSSWSNWGNATIHSGYHDIFCIKDKNRIRVRVYFNYGTYVTCAAYGTSSC